MASTAKTKDKDVGARERLMEATAQIMLDEGYAAATSRRVAARAGVRSALVYYYFPAMDDLFVAVLRAGSEASLARMRQAITAEEPLRALWSINTDPRWTGLYAEFVALANHRKAISAELKTMRNGSATSKPPLPQSHCAHKASTSTSTRPCRSRCRCTDRPQSVQRERYRDDRGSRGDARAGGPFRESVRLHRSAATWLLSMLPPSTVIVRPVTKRDSSDAKNSTALLISTGSTQPIGSTCIIWATTAMSWARVLKVRTEELHRAFVHEQWGVDVGGMYRVHPDGVMTQFDGEGRISPTTPCLAAM